MGHFFATFGEKIVSSEANIIKKKKLLGRIIPYFACKVWNKNAQYVVLKKHDVLGIFKIHNFVT